MFMLKATKIANKKQLVKSCQLRSTSALDQPIACFSTSGTPDEPQDPLADIIRNYSSVSSPSARFQLLLKSSIGAL